MKREKRERAGLTILDVILAVLILAAVLSTVFYDQIHSFLREENAVRVEYTFLVENVTAAAVNLPKEGEELIEIGSQSSLGRLTNLTQSSHTYGNGDDELTVSTLTCKAAADAVEENGMILVSGLKIKPGVTYTAVTASASFKMTIITVKTVD